MARRFVPVSTEHPYHLTARCVNREWFQLPIEDVWKIMEDYLFLTHSLYGMKIHAFVLMPNHFHLLASFPHGNIGPCMNYFMRETSREITRLSCRINQTYGARHHKSMIDSYHYFMNVYKYIYRNPVRAKLSKFVEAYPYSTLAGLCGLRKLVIPLEPDILIFNPDFQLDILNWLNTKPKPEHEAEIRKGLRHPTFTLKTPRNKKESVLKSSLL